MDQTFEKRKKLIYDIICDEFYMPMKLNDLTASTEGSEKRTESDYGFAGSGRQGTCI